MADDGVGAGDEGLLIARNLLEILALQAFGGELDRRQRILDLMGDTPCDIGPGRLALGREEFRYVIEGTDEPFDFMSVLLHADAYLKTAGLLPAGQPIGQATGRERGGQDVKVRVVA